MLRWSFAQAHDATARSRNQKSVRHDLIAETTDEAARQRDLAMRGAASRCRPAGQGCPGTPGCGPGRKASQALRATDDENLVWLWDEVAAALESAAAQCEAAARTPGRRARPGPSPLADALTALAAAVHAARTRLGYGPDLTWPLLGALGLGMPLMPAPSG